MTLDDRKALRRKALWKVGDFARYLGISHWQARSALTRYNLALGGMLLRPSRGSNRGYTFFWALLAKHDVNIFLDDPIEMQKRLDTIEDVVGDMQSSLRGVMMQTGQNNRDIARLKTRRAAAA